MLFIAMHLVSFLDMFGHPLLLSNNKLALFGLRLKGQVIESRARIRVG